jgi:hypothetical protein
MRRRDFLKSAAGSAIGFSAVSQLQTSDVFGKETASMSSATSHKVRKEEQKR